jgi:ABC-2 type transport system permease protein
MTLRQNIIDGFIIFTVLVQPLVIAMLALWMLRDRAAEQAIFIVVGSGLTGLWSSLLFISGNSITSERWSGTLEMLVGQPTPLPVIVFGKNLAHVTQSLGSMIVAYGLSTLVFGYSLQIQETIHFVVSLGLAVIAFVCFGLIIAPLFIMNPAIQGWQNALEFPVYILSGFLFTIALLPDWTTPVSYLLAPYWAARALHGSSSGVTAISEIYFSWGMLILFSTLYLILAGYLFKKMLYKTRVDATLGFQ